MTTSTDPPSDRTSAGPDPHPHQPGTDHHEGTDAAMHEMGLPDNGAGLLRSPRSARSAGSHGVDDHQFRAAVVVMGTPAYIS